MTFTIYFGWWLIPTSITAAATLVGAFETDVLFGGNCAGLYGIVTGVFTFFIYFALHFFIGIV